MQWFVDAVAKKLVIRTETEEDKLALQDEGFSPENLMRDYTDWEARGGMAVIGENEDGKLVGTAVWRDDTGKWRSNAVYLLPEDWRSKLLQGELRLARV